jgi:hypothetical protein
MSKYEAFTGLPVEHDEPRTRRWAAILVKAALAVFAVGAVLAAVLWMVDPDIGALTLSIGFSGLVGLMVLRQALLAERR